MKAKQFLPKAEKECYYCAMNHDKKDCTVKDMTFPVNDKPKDNDLELVFRRVYVAGLLCNEKDALNMLKGNNLSLSLKKEVNNPYDEDAIAVIGNWEKGKKKMSANLGYLPAEVSSDITKHYANKELFAFLKVIYPPKKAVIKDGKAIRAPQRLYIFFDIYAHKEGK